jgi:succinate dehydrogenase / fumarate reductase membrane anchor subunit
MSMRTPLSRVRYLGSAHEGTGHFWRQRLTGAANAILVIALIAVVVSLIGEPYDAVAARLGSPFVAALFILFFISAAIHMRIGLQVVVEDYIHGEGLKVVLLAASTFFSIGVAAVAILACLKLALGV